MGALKWGLGYLPSIVHNCLHLLSFNDENSFYRRLCPQASRVSRWENFVSWLVELVEDFCLIFCAHFSWKLKDETAAKKFAYSSLHFPPTSARNNFALGAFRRSKRAQNPQKCTTVDDCARVAESGLKSPFDNPQLYSPKNSIHGKPPGSPRVVLWSQDRSMQDQSSQITRPTDHTHIFGVSCWGPFLKSIRAFSVVGLTANSD